MHLRTRLLNFLFYFYIILILFVYLFHFFVSNFVYVVFRLVRPKFRIGHKQRPSAGRKQSRVHPHPFTASFGYVCLFSVKTDHRVCVCISSLNLVTRELKYFRHALDSSLLPSRLGDTHTRTGII